MIETSSWNILIVDDEPAFCEMISDVLEFSGRFRSIIIAHNAFEAKQKMQNQHFDLLLIDNNMPNQTGLDFIRILKFKTFRKPPKIILLSGALQKDDLVAALTLNIKNILVKPFSNGKLVEMIDEVMNED